jgi:hypothetical protein
MQSAVGRSGETSRAEEEPGTDHSAAAGQAWTISET